MRTLILGLIFATLTAGHALAQTPPKIAVADLNKIFENYWKTKQAKAIIKDRVEGILKEKKDMETDLAKLNGDYEKAANDAKDPNISAEEKDKRQKAALAVLQKLKDTDTDMKKYLANADENLTAQKKRLGDRVLEEIKEAVKAKAQGAGFTYVFNSAAEGISGPVLLFASSESATDITELVVKSLNEGAPADATADVKKSDDTTKPDQSKVSTNESKKSP